VGIGGSVFAGEVNGSDNPKAKGPQATVDIFLGEGANSICAFSGLNDVPTGDFMTDDEGNLILDENGEPIIDPLSVGKVQNWGHTQRIAKSLLPPEVFAVERAANKPGVTCNGRTGIVAVVTGG
jgi:hypothetical protein